MLLSRARDRVNKQMGASRRIDRSFLACLLFLLILIWSNVCAAQNPDLDQFDRAVKYIAEKICTAAGDHASMVLEVRNLSTLSAAEVGGVRRALEGELRNRGARLAAALPADADVRVTLSENLQDDLWVAEIHHGDSQQTAMITVPRARQSAQPNTAPALTLQKQLVWQQTGPMLDFRVAPFGAAQPGGVNRLLVLEPERVALYQSIAGGRQFAGAVQIQHAQPWPRDTRGLLVVDGERFQAFLPGIKCSGTLQPALSASCQQSGEPWPIISEPAKMFAAAFSPRRNYFENQTYGPADWMKQIPATYAWAVESGDTQLWGFTFVDGRALFALGNPPPHLHEISGAGSEMAGLKSDCGSGWQLLGTKTGDWTVGDAIQAYEISVDQAMAVGQPLEFDGPVTALWPSASGQVTNAVVHNLKTGKYEAYGISITCIH